MMRITFFRVLFLLLASTVAACLLFPAVWQILLFWGMQDQLPARVMRRFWMIAVFLGLLSSWKYLGLQHPAQVGYEWSRGAIRNLLIGTAVVWGFLILLSCIFFSLNIWEQAPHINLPRILQLFFRGLVRGTLVAAFEEYIFRGMIFFSLRRRWGWRWAALASSLIFASLHFLEGGGLDSGIDPNRWYTGFILCGRMLANMTREFTLFPDAFGLFLVGVILCYSVDRTGSLWYGAGLHGGWVWYVTFKPALFYLPVGFNDWLYGGGRLFNGVVPIIGMLIIFPITHWLVQRRVVSCK